MNKGKNIKTDLVILAQRKADEREAKVYSMGVERERKIKKAKTTTLGVVFAILLLAGMKIVGDNDLESLGIIAKENKSETESITELITMDGYVLFDNVIYCEDDYRRRKENDFPEGTLVSILFDSKGTENPNDDYVFYANRK